MGRDELMRFECYAPKREYLQEVKSVLCDLHDHIASFDASETVCQL